MQTTLEKPLKKINVEPHLISQDEPPLAVFSAKIYEKPLRRMLMWSLMGLAVSAGAKYLARRWKERPLDKEEPRLRAEDLH
jgi:hypothetical protein